MPKFKDLLSAFGLAPKTLDQAKASLDSAKPALDSVAALFSTAGLDLDSLIAAGPDSLKAHLDGLSANDADLASAQAKVTALEGQLAARDLDVTAAAANLIASNAKISALNQAIGFNPAEKGEDGNPLEFKAAFESHVAKQSALLLAKDGRPPVKQAGLKQVESNVMTRSAYLALSPKDGLAFAKAGGRITE